MTSGYISATMSKFAGNQVGNTMAVTGISTRVPRIGELLIAAKIIKPDVLNESLQIARTSKTLIGRTLVRLGQLYEHKLQSALEIQTLIRKRILGSQLGIKALTIACSRNISVDEALDNLDGPYPRVLLKESISRMPLSRQSYCFWHT